MSKLEQQAEQELYAFQSQLAATAELHKMSFRLTNKCWSRCITKPSTVFDSKERACIDQCLDRYLDAAQIATQRIAAASASAAGAGTGASS